MDPVTLAIGVGVAVVIATVMVVIAKFSFGGETEYEEQIARQKEILLDDNKGKVADKKKVKAEKKKKVKSKVESGAGSELEAESGKDEADVTPRGAESSTDELAHAHIEYDPDPVIIESDQTAEVPRSKTAKKNKARRKRLLKQSKSKPPEETAAFFRGVMKKAAPAPVKSILHNRDEVPVVRSKTASVAETVFSEEAPPKDDLELALSKTRKFGKKNKPVHVAAEEPVPVVDDIVVPTQARSQASAAPPPQVVEEMIVAKTDMSVSAPAPSKRVKVKSAMTSSAKGSPSDLSGIMELVQQAPLTRHELQTLVESILARQDSEDSWTTKSARPDPVAQLRKQLEEAQNALTGEQTNAASAQAKVKELTAKWAAAEKLSSGATVQIQELKKRMQTTHDQHKADVQAVTAQGYQDKQKVEQQIEVINQLSEENQRLKQSVASTDEVAQMQNQLRALNAEKQTLNARIAEMEKDVIDSKHELVKFQETFKTLEKEKGDLRRRCDELGVKLAQSETQCLDNQNRAAEMEKNMKNLQDHIRTQQKDSETQVQELRDELSRTKEVQLHSPATNSNQTNGTTNGMSPTITELESRVSSLTQAVTDKDDQINNLNKQLAVARASQSELDALRQKSAGDSSQHKDVEKQISDLEGQIQTLKDKNNELRRKNWALNDSLEKAEKSSLSSTTTQSDLEDKICAINELKDSNSKLRSQNNELQDRCDNLSTLTNEVSSLKKQLNETRVSLDNKDTIIKQLEESLKLEKQNLTAVESECREILEKEFSRTVKTMSVEHQVLVDKLTSEMNKKVETMGALERSQGEQQKVIGELEISNSKSDAEVKKLTEQISSLNKQMQALRSDKQTLEGRLEELSSQQVKSSTATESESSLALYQRTLIDVEQMVDALGQKIEDEHKKTSITLDSKDRELSTLQEKFAIALKEVTESHSKQVELERIAAEQMKTAELSKLESALKEEQLKSRQLAQHLAAAMAASGGGDDSGTCV